MSGLRIACLFILILLVRSASLHAAEAQPHVGKAVLITGASSGIGRHAAEQLAAAGYFVYAGARKDADLEALSQIENIQAVLEPLDIDLYTHVVDNKEYCDVFKSFFQASVSEIDTPSDLSLATTTRTPSSSSNAHGAADRCATTSSPPAQPTTPNRQKTETRGTSMPKPCGSPRMF